MLRGQHILKQRVVLQVVLEHLRDLLETHRPLKQQGVIQVDFKELLGGRDEVGVVGVFLRDPLVNRKLDLEHLVDHRADVGDLVVVPYHLQGTSKGTQEQFFYTFVQVAAEAGDDSVICLVILADSDQDGKLDGGSLNGSSLIDCFIISLLGEEVTDCFEEQTLPVDDETLFLQSFNALNVVDDVADAGVAADVDGGAGPAIVYGFGEHCGAVGEPAQ